MRSQVLLDKKKEKKEQKQQKKIKKKVEIPDKIFTLFSDDEEDNDLKDIEEETNQYEPNVRKYNKTQSNGPTNQLFSENFLN